MDNDPVTRMHRSFGDFHLAFSLFTLSLISGSRTSFVITDQSGNGSGGGDQLAANDDFLPQPDLEENAEIGGGARKIFSVGSVPNFDVISARTKG